MMEAAETEIHPMRGLGLGRYSVARTLTTLNVEAHSTEVGNTYLKYQIRLRLPQFDLLLLWYILLQHF